MQKNRPETRTNATRMQNAARKRPRAINSANIAPTHRQNGGSLNRAGLPLKHVRTALMLKLKHIALTRLGTDSGAADFDAPRVRPRRRSRKFSRKFVKNYYFANFSDAPHARGYRELPVVKISALNDPWRYQKRQKPKKNRNFLRFGIQILVIFDRFWKS